MRIIDGDSLKEEISNWTITITGVRAGKGVLVEFMREYRKTILRTIDEQPTIEYGTWIPCSERLPEESLNSVIGWDEYRQRCVFVQYWRGHWRFANLDDSVKIIAWMSLPEPYREEKKDGEP